MATIFTRILDGELPGEFVWRDERCGVFLALGPLRPGHALVVPIEEVDHWLDLSPDLVAHLFQVAQMIGEAQMAAFSPTRIGLIVAGLEVPHTHVHVIPIRDEADLDFANASRDHDPQAMAEAAEAIRVALRAAGRDEVATA